MRALTRVADADGEAELIELARHATAAQLERMVRAARRCTAADADEARRESFVRWYWDDEDGCLRIDAKLPPEDGALVLRALEAARDAIHAERAAEADEPRDGSAGPLAADRAERFRGTASRRLTQQRRVARRARRGGARPAADQHGGRRALSGLRARRRRDPGHGLARGERDGTGRVRDCRRAGDRARDRPAPGVRLLLRGPRRAGRQTAQRRPAHALDPAGDPPRARRTRRPLSVSRLRAKTIRRCAPHPPLGPRRRDRPRQPRAALPPSSSARPRGRLLGRARRRGPTALQGSG